METTTNINTSPRKDLVTQTTQTLNHPQNPLIIGGLIVSVLLEIYLLFTQSLSQPILLIIGILLGYTLFHERFGFTSAFRRLMSVGNGQALRSNLLMLAVAVILFAPILATGFSFFNGAASGYVAPVGVSLIVGAFMFGVGMQLGGGRSVMLITLLFFIVGSTIGAYHLPFWTQELPSFQPISLATSTGFGYGGAWIVSIVLFGLNAWITILIEKKKNAPKLAPLPSAVG